MEIISACTKASPVSQELILLPGNLTITASKQSLFAHVRDFGSNHSDVPKNLKYARLLHMRRPKHNIWLDENILKVLFQHLRQRDLLTYSVVCKQWRELFVANFTEGLRLVIDFKRISPLKGTILEQQLRLAYRWKITTLALVNMLNEHIPYFMSAYYVTFKEFFPGCLISYSEVEDDIFKSVPYMLPRSQTHYSSCGEDLGCSTLKRLGSAPFKILSRGSRHITQLCIDNSPLSDWALDQIMRIMHTVTVLSIFSCNCLSDVALWCCLRPWITHLNLRDCLHFNNDALQAIVQCAPSLQELRLQVYHLSDLALDSFEARSHFNLRVLWLCYCSDLTIIGVTKLAAALPGLQELRLIGCSKLNDASVDLICKCMKYLQVLDLSSNNLITDSALASIADGLRQLEELHLDRCNSLSDGGIKSVSNVRGLRVLTLRWCSGLGDECLQYLTNLTCLRFLSLAGCKTLTTDGFIVLTAMKRLRHLEITNTQSPCKTKLYLSKLMSGCVITD
uniref:F-box domain-containing protein n=1 Tax=Mesocestoides corti TaxID=53468 RepID=A0A5K3F6C4_MESCO